MHRERRGRPDDPAHEKPALPVVFGYDMVAYSFTRILHEAAGARSLVVADATRGPIDHLSVFDARLVGRGSLDDEAALLNILDSLAHKFPNCRLILLVSMDETVGLVARHRDSLSRNWFLPYEDRKAVAIADSKAEMAVIVVGLDLDAPARTRIDLRELASWEGTLGDVTFSVVVKPEGTNNLSHYRNQGLCKALPLETHEVTLAIFARRHERGVDVRLIIQKLVPGNGTTRWVANGYADARGTVVACDFGRVIPGLRQPEYLGNTRVILIEHDPELIGQAKSTVTRTGLYGFFSMDVKVDPRGDIARWLDLSPCIDHGRYYPEIAGVGLAKTMLTDIEESGADGAPGAELGQADVAKRFCQGDVPSADPVPEGTACTTNVCETIFYIIPVSLANRRYIRDADLYARVRRTEEADVVNPLTCSMDRNLKRAFYRLANGFNQRRWIRVWYPEPTSSRF